MNRFIDDPLGIRKKNEDVEDIMGVRGEKRTKRANGVIFNG
jgi:hypothetical protein